MGSTNSKPSSATTRDWWAKGVIESGRAFRNTDTHRPTDIQAKIELAHEYVVKIAPTVPADAPFEYVQFLAIKGAFEDRHAAIFSPPTREIDEFWHQHILDTLAYEESMHGMGGIFIHHNPRGGNDRTEQAARVRRYNFVHEQAFSSDDASRLMLTFCGVNRDATRVKLSLPADATAQDAATMLEQNGYSRNPRLIFNGKQILNEASKKLSEHGVTSGAQIYFVPRLPGC